MQMIPSIPENAPFTAEQRVWLNGYLAGLLAAGATSSGAAASEAPAPPATSVVILFGSQTGTAEGLARRLAREAGSRRFAARVVDAAAHASIDWKQEKNLLVITSTYGDGEMPDNALDFWNWLQTEAASSVSHLAFSVLALGDTNYAEFCAAGKKIDARLEQLGARRAHPRVDCDVDYEAPAKSWSEAALGALAPPASGAPAFEPAPRPAAAVSEAVKPWSKTNPFPARLRTNRRLNADGSGKETRHFEIILGENSVAYETGDALGVYPTNCPELVSGLLSALGCDGEEAVPSPEGREIPLRKALLESYDINKPGSEFLQRVAEKNVILRELIPAERKEDLRKWLWGREVVDLLIETPGLGFEPAEFARLLKKLPPRLYSISSSPKEHAGEVHLTVGIVRYDSFGRSRKGVCSTFLADRAGENVPVPVFIHTSPGFRLPSSGETPIIMVGPGTGIAPFRSFLYERRATGARGRNWLFFGEQRAATDFYYREEWDRMRADGHLTRFDTAFSRDQAEKVYVQHRLLENAAALWSWLQEGAHFYVCGDASRMAKDVDLALHQVIEKAGGMSAETAAEYVRKLKAAKRYQRDVY